MLTIPLYICTAISALYIFLELTWRLWTRRFRFLPSAPTVPWLGTIPFLGSSSRDFYKALTTYAKRYDHCYVMWMGPKPVIHCGRVEYIEPLLRSNENELLMKAKTSYDILDDWFGTGLLTSGPSSWKPQRRALARAFHSTLLNDFKEVYERNATKIVTKLHSFANTGKHVDVQTWLKLVALDVMCETSMGVCVDALESFSADGRISEYSYNLEYVQAVEQTNKLMVQRMLNPLLASKFIYQLTKDGKDYYRCIDVLHGYTLRIIKEKIAERSEESERSSEVRNIAEETVKKKMNILDALLDMYEKGEIDMKGIRDNVNTFMHAGHDTIAMTLAFALYEIGRHPQIQERLHKEIDEQPLKDRIGELKYLDCVIKETLRLHSPVVDYGREIEKDITLGGHVIPGGCEISIEPSNTHSNEQYWPDAERFDPDRFENEDEVKRRNRYTYVPFSAGPRNCLGQKIAMHEAKVFLHAILSDFEIKSVQAPDELEMCFDIIVHSANGVNIEFYKR